MCFSKVPGTFRAREGSCKYAIRLFLKADLWACFKRQKNQEDYEVWCLWTSALRRYKGNWCDLKSFRTLEEYVPGVVVPLPSMLFGPCIEGKTHLQHGAPRSKNDVTAYAERWRKGLFGFRAFIKEPTLCPLWSSGLLSISWLRRILSLYMLV